VRIAFVINEFPSVSETFILDQMVGLIERGHEVQIYAERPQQMPRKLHADVERLQMLGRTRYRELAPTGRTARVRSGISRALRWGWKYPGPLMDGLNVFRHGRRALNFSMVHKIFPSREPAPRCDVVHSHYGPNGVRAVYWREAGILEGPVITTFHGYDANMLPRTQGPELYQKLFADADCFTAGSEFMRKRLISLGAPAERIVKLPMGVDVRKYQCAERHRDEAGELRLLSIARLVEVKGIEYALKALARVKPRLGRFRYQIAGDGPLLGSLKALARELGIDDAVEFLGAVSREEALGFYEQAHIFLLPSVLTETGEEENQPVVLAEAQAAGLPVIATRIGGVPESIREGESGLLVAPRDSEALGEAILRVAEHPERWPEMGRAGRRLVESDFNLEKLNERLLELYEELICAKPTGRVTSCTT